MKKYLILISFVLMSLFSFGQRTESKERYNTDSLVERVLERGIEVIGAVRAHDSLSLYTVPVSTLSRDYIMVVDTNTGLVKMINKANVFNGTFPDSCVIFSGPNGELDTDSNYFRWDYVNKTLNLGPGIGGDEMNVYADSGENSKIYIEGGGSLNGIVGTTNWGTFANPQPRGTRGTLLEFSAARWNGTAFTSTRGASMTLFSTQAPWSANANGMGVKLYCVANNSTTSIQSLQIWGDGHISTSTVSSGRDTIAEFWCDGDMVIRTTLPSYMSGDSIFVKDTMGTVRTWIPREQIALKNDTNSMTGLNIGGKVGSDEINVYADAGENAKIFIEGTGTLNGILGTRNFGTLAVPVAPSSPASTLITFGSAGWNGSAFTSVKRGSFDVLSTQAWGSSNNASAIKINYVPNASTTSTQGLLIWSNGNSAFSSNSADTLYKLYVDGEMRASGKVTAGDDVTTASGASFTWTSNSRIYSDINGIIRLTNNANNDFSRLQLGGSTSSFPAIKRNGVRIDFVLADNSAPTIISASQAILLDTVASGNITMGVATHYSFSGTTATWTLPTLAASDGYTYFIKNRGSGDLTINTNAAGTDIYSTSAVNTIVVAAGASLILHNDGTYFTTQ